MNLTGIGGLHPVRELLKDVEHAKIILSYCKPPILMLSAEPWQPLPEL